MRFFVAHSAQEYRIVSSNVVDQWIRSRLHRIAKISRQRIQKNSGITTLLIVRRSFKSFRSERDRCCSTTIYRGVTMITMSSKRGPIKLHCSLVEKIYDSYRTSCEQVIDDFWFQRFQQFLWNHLILEDTYFILIRILRIFHTNWKTPPENEISGN